MLNRRYLRIKAMLALYAYYQSGSDRHDLNEKQMLLTIDAIYELFIYQLSILPELVHFANLRLDDAKQKFFPTEEEKNPNTKFINNKLIQHLQKNRDFQKKINEYKISWVGEYDIIGAMFDKIKKSSTYENYMASEEDSFDNDREFIIKLYKKYFIDSDILQSYFEEKNIYWTDDYYTAGFLIIKTLSNIKENDDEFVSLPPLFHKTPDNINEDKIFVIDLFRKTIAISDECDTLIQPRLKNWDMERIALIDMLLMKMTLAEVLYFPTIPIKVSLNEYLDIAKEYSTPQSSTFINGILDAVVNELKEGKKIKKAGRGLIQ